MPSFSSGSSGAAIPSAALFGLLTALAAVTGACGNAGPDGTVSLPPPRTGTPSVQSGFLVSAVVERVIDGLTILVSQDGETFEVRYLGIEIPDSSATAAVEQNRHLVEGRTVELEIDVIQSDTSGRALRYVYVGGEMVNEVLLASGHAFVSGFPGEFRYRDRLIVAQERARAQSRGVWGTASAPTPITAETEPFRGGTIPSRPGGEEAVICDYTGTPQPVIKGVADHSTGTGVYYAPGDLGYEAVIVDVTVGDRWFCTEPEAAAAGWLHSSGS